MEKMFGSPVVEMSRGRGSELTEFGQRLVWAEKLIHARLDPLLESMAMEVNAEIQNALTRARDHLNPIGALEPAALKQFEKVLLPSHALVNLATRRQGLIVKRANPKNIWSIKDLKNPDVLFVNRQPGSGTRIILDLLLEQEGEAGQAINGFDHVEHTHAAVGAYVASGKADAGLGVETAARQFDLDFVPIVTERYFLLCEQRMLMDARFKPIHDYLKASEFRTEVSKLPGYDSSFTGTVMSLEEAFPQQKFK